MLSWYLLKKRTPLPSRVSFSMTSFKDSLFKAFVLGNPPLHAHVCQELWHCRPTFYWNISHFTRRATKEKPMFSSFHLQLSSMPACPFKTPVHRSHMPWLAFIGFISAFTLFCSSVSEPRCERLPPLPLKWNHCTYLLAWRVQTQLCREMTSAQHCTQESASTLKKLVPHNLCHLSLSTIPESSAAV